MAKQERVVTKISSDSKRDVPDYLNPFVVIADFLTHRGVIDEIASRFRLARNKGFEGIDVLAFLLAFFSASPVFRSLRHFSDRTSKWRPVLAALIGRKTLPSQSSVSRALVAVEEEQVREFSDWLLQESVDDSRVVNHESVTTIDCEGQSWHVFHFDGRVHARRRRGLAEGDELREAKRLDEKAARPGYSGRKRGEVQNHRSLLQHAGSGQWLMIRSGSGTGSLAEDLEGGCSTVKSWAAHRDVDVKRCLICVDGADGGYPQIKTAWKAGIDIITRMGRYEKLKSREVKKHLAKCRWERVEDSGSGPVRYAAELGEDTLEDGAVVRLIVTAFVPQKDKKSGAGYFFDGVQYEIFAATLERSAWPAGAVVTEYYARCGQENRFHQLDKDLLFLHTYSEHPAGQTMAETAALWLWNLQIVIGAEMVLDDTPSGRKPRARQVDSGTFSTFFGKQPLGLQQEAQTTPEKAKEHEKAQQERDFHDYMEAYFAKKPGWSWDPEFTAPRCPENLLLRLHDLTPAPNEYTHIRFRGAHADCTTCVERRICSISTAKRFQKEVSISVPIDPMTLSLLLNSKLIDEERISRRLELDIGHAEADKATVRMAPSLLPSVLRHQFLQSCLQSIIRLEVGPAPQPEPTKPHYAPDPAARQRRRKTWAQRLQWNALPEKTAISIELEVDEALYPVMMRMSA